MLDNKPDTLQGLIDSITPEIHGKLRTAIELGRWENGQPLSKGQLEHCLQAVIAYEHKKTPVDQRTGFIDPESVAGKKACADPAQTIVSDRPGACEDDGNDA